MLKLPTTPFFVSVLSVMGGLHGVCHHHHQDRIIISSSLVQVLFSKDGLQIPDTYEIVKTK
jgi:hypothetical protein